VSPAKTAEPIEMLFGRLTWVVPRKRVLDGVQIPQENRQFLGVVWTFEKHRQTVYAKTADLIEVPFVGLTHVGPSNH